MVLYWFLHGFTKVFMWFYMFFVVIYVLCRFIRTVFCGKVCVKFKKSKE